MAKHKHLGFTVVELVVVIVVIAMLVTITTIAYRTTQADSRDKKRQADVMMLKAAIEEYYADNGSYPKFTTCTSWGGTECWIGEAWQLLKDNGYLDKIPMPALKVTHSGVAASNKNQAPDGNSFYGYVSSTADSSGKNYAIFVPLESGDCKTGKNVPSGWWNSVKSCDF